MSNSISSRTSSAAVRTLSFRPLAFLIAAVALVAGAFIGNYTYKAFQPYEIGECYSTAVEPGESVHSSALRALENNDNVEIDRVSGLKNAAQRANADKQSVIPGDTTLVCLTPNGKKVASINGINAR